MEFLTDYKIPVGKTAKAVFEWMNANLGGVFDAISVAMEAMINGILYVLQTCIRLSSSPCSSPSHGSCNTAGKSASAY